MRPSHFPKLLLTLTLSLVGCSKSQSPPAMESELGTAERSNVSDPILASHEQMLKRLREVHRESVDNPLFGRGSLLEAQGKYKRAITDRDFMGMLDAIASYSKQLTFAGKPDDALDVLAEADELFAVMHDTGAPPDLIASWESSIYFVKALAGLRKAENENCVHCQEGEGCLFPIRPKGIHKITTGSEIAKQSLMKVLKHQPDDASAIWLLNLTHMTLGSFPDEVPKAHRLPEERLKSDTDFPWFRNIALPLGLDTMSLCGGVIADDFDGDHHLDLIVSDWSSEGQIRYFHNQQNGSFEEQTKPANLTGIVGALNLVQADYDNDGDVDVFMPRGAWLHNYGRHPNSLLQNDGTGRFHDVTFHAGLAGNDLPTQTAAWQDFDLDGDLDLFVGNEKYPSQLFENDGKGHFTEISRRIGLNINSFVKGAAWGDVDNDGYPDLYVSNALSPNRLYRNAAGKGFVDITQKSGTGEPAASFAVWFWDYNNDGMLDLYCPGYREGLQFVAEDYLGRPSEGQTDVLYQGQGNGVFKDVSQEVGFDRISQTMGCNYGDLDNDGFLDIYLGTGYPGFEALMPNVMYRNDSGKLFQDVSVAGGFSHLQKGHAVAFADFDHDGDQDVFAELGGAYPGDAFRNALFENPGFDRHSLSVRLIGTQTNRSAIGARIKATFRDETGSRSVYRWISSGSSFGSNSFREFIGTADADVVDLLEISWPVSGQTQVFKQVPCDQLILITEGEPDYSVVELVPQKFVAGQIDSENNLQD